MSDDRVSDDRVDPVRATSFGTIAEDYDRYRPGPPVEAVRWIVPDGARRAVDLGAGTGALSALLGATVDDVVAVELDPRMLAVTRRRAPRARRVVGRAEALPLAEGSADLVGVSSAWHWMDPGRALPEVARVLRPGGVLGLLRGGPDRTVGWVAEVLARNDPGTGGDGRDRRWRVAPEVPAGVPLGSYEERTFDATTTYPVADLPGLAASYSGVITLPEAERQAVLDAVAQRVATIPDLAGRDTVELPLRCRVMRLVRDR